MRTIRGRILASIPAVISAITLGIASGARGADAGTDTQATESSGLQEIVVTARKREESAMRAPVIMDVVPAQEIANLKIQDLYDLAAVTPGLHIDTGFGQVGTVLYLRGIGSGDSATYIDQSVGLNIDGMSMSHGTFYKSGTFDLAQMELLKGPQGMFFGKSTTAGVVALHTADPTPQWESMVSDGYEFKADEEILNAYISGPITDKLGIRLAGYYDGEKGWLYNPNPDAAAERLPDSGTRAGRLTLKYDDPDIGFRAKLKVTGLQEHSDGNAGSLNQGFSCPLGYRQNTVVRSFDDCRLDQYTQGFGNAPPYNPNVNWPAALGNAAAFATGQQNPLVGSGAPYDRTASDIAVLQLDYDLTKDLTLTSVTGYSWVTTTDASGNSAFGGGPGTAAFEVIGDYAETDYTEEIRLASNWKGGWVNFMVGALDAPGYDTLNAYGNVPLYTTWANAFLKQESKVDSAFGELMLTPIDKWEFDAGLRYTHVHKYFTNLNIKSDFNAAIGQPYGAELVSSFPYNDTNVSETNTSPEFTLTYRPTDDWTAFASYKWGYKGPGFNAEDFNIFTPLAVSPFGGEKVHGAEGGIKAQFLDRHLAVTASVYDYDYIGLQVSNYNYTTQAIVTTNGANANTKGVELTASYLPDVIQGLQIDASVDYNDAKYLSFTDSPCWGGQTIAEGCSNPVTGAAQNLAGRPLSQAPAWVGSLGASYRTAVTGDYSLAFNENTNFSSGYFTVPDELPGAYQKGWVTIDAGARFGRLDGPWEVALIGRNLTNRLYVIAASDSGTAFPGVQADAFGFTNRARQIMLQVTVRPNKLF